MGLSSIGIVELLVSFLHGVTRVVHEFPLTVARPLFFDDRFKATIIGQFVVEPINERLRLIVILRQFVAVVLGEDNPIVGGVGVDGEDILGKRNAWVVGSRVGRDLVIVQTRVLEAIGNLLGREPTVGLNLEGLLQEIVQSVLSCDRIHIFSFW